MHKIVIVGGGFGGVKTALELSQDRRLRVTLVSDRADFRYYPSLYRTATGGRRMLSTIPLEEIFANTSVHLLQDKATIVNRQQRTLQTQVGHKLPYDALVLALGVQTNYFGIKGLEEYSFGIKTVEDAEQLKQHLHNQLTANKMDFSYVVIGGGPTGVELAGELPAYLKTIAREHGIRDPKIHVDLVEGAPRILPRMPKDMSRVVARRLRKLGIRLYLGRRVEAETADSLVLNNKKIRSHSVIWTAGVTNHPFFSENQFQLTHNGRVRVDQFLQAEPGIYVIGDNADTPYSGMAQTAIYDGKYIAKNLRRLAQQDDPIPYSAKKPVYVIPVGRYWSAVLWGHWRIYSFWGWLLRRAADLVGYHDYQPWQRATQRWLAEDDREESCPICQQI